MPAPDEIQYRIITNISEMSQIPILERHVWGMSELDCIPPSLLISLMHTGGSLIGAFWGEMLVGVCVGMPTSQRNRLWSYMTAVHTNYQNLGIGQKLKQEQYKFAADQNYAAIGWTFDPLQARNAYFNFCTIGVVAKRYHVDFYGPMTDALNNGLPSDRLEVEWNITPDHRGNAINHKDHTLTPTLLAEDTHMEPLVNIDALNHGTSIAVQIPSNINWLRSAFPNVAIKWRLTLRECLIMSFAEGYEVVGLHHAEERYAYLLHKANYWFLYIVKCADGSLYTGISTDLKRRIKQHNAGTGAAYTASRRPVTFQGAWQFADRAAATRAELHLKRLRRTDKDKLVQGHLAFEGANFIDSF